MKKSIILFLVVLSISSCLNMKVTTHIPYRNDTNIKKIAIFEVLVGKPIQAVLPLIDAAAFNSKMNKIADEIMDTQKQKANVYRDALATNMKAQFGCEIIYGKELQNMPNFKLLKNSLANFESLQTRNDNYPIVQIAEGEFNAFPFERGKVNDFFIGSVDYSNVISEICKDLNLDAIAISFTQMNTVGVAAFGISANSRVSTNLFIFDKNGKKIGHGSAYSKVIRIKGKEIADYNMILDEFNVIITPLTEQLTKPKIN